MPDYHILGLDARITDEVRTTLKAPGYGHPVVRELARGTGPCRACLRPFHVGHEERLLFTYRPRGGPDYAGAPGPVVIHAGACPQYRGAGFPPALHEFDVLLEAWAPGNRITSTHRARGSDADAVIAQLLADDDVAYLHVRHAEAGCHIARVERGALPALSRTPPSPAPR